MQTYTTLSRKVYDLDGLNDEERAHFERAYAAYLAGRDWGAFARRFVYGIESPVLRASGGRVTREVLDHLLYRVVHDLSDRLGVAQNTIGAMPGDDLETGPLEDEWLPVADAAERKGVGVSGLHSAIKRGDVLARPAKEGGAWLAVSGRSLANWRPEEKRQAAGRSHRRDAAAEAS
ncbi:MAG: hypothetical protein NTZ05_15650 [Chloroflexi bacterium]|nr:hypothetical protein [Chloroflexota bacterium]